MAVGISYSNRGELALAPENLQKAYALSSRVSERERLYITAQYYNIASGELGKAQQTYLLRTQLYPRDYVAYGNLGVVGTGLGNCAGRDRTPRRFAHFHHPWCTLGAWASVRKGGVWSGVGCSLTLFLTKARFVGILIGKVGAWDKKAVPVPNMQDSNLRPAWRIRHTLNEQKVTNGTPPPQKDVKNEGRCGNVYENKG